MPIPSNQKPQIKALLLALSDRPVAHYLCRNLVRFGFDIRAIYPVGSVLNYTRYLPKGGCLSPFHKWCSIILAAENWFGEPIVLRPIGTLAVRFLKRRLLTVTMQWLPDVLIPLDERAIRLCRDLLAGRAGCLPTSLEALLKRSLGNPQTLNQRLSRKGNYEAACEAGIRVPMQVAPAHLGEVRDFARTVGYPIVVKEENTAGGVGVTVCPDERTLFAAVYQPASKVGAGRLKKLLTMWLQPSQKALRGITLQQFVTGVPTMREVLCWDGRVVAGFSLAKIESYPASTGAASVVRAIDNAEMAEATQRLVAKLGLNGFADVDFIVDEASKAAYCIELNARPTGLTHLGAHFGGSLELALHRLLADTGAPELPSSCGNDTVAIFPKEWWRDPQSEALYSAYHDLPWDDPEVVRYYVSKTPDPF